MAKERDSDLYDVTLQSWLMDLHKTGKQHASSLQWRNDRITQEHRAGKNEQ